MSNKSVILLIFFFLVACSKELQKTYENIVSNPKSFDGEAVEVNGFFRRDLGVFLYSNLDHANKLQFDTAIEVQDRSVEDLLVSGCKDQFVRIAGKIVVINGRAKITEFDSVYSIDHEKVCWRSS